jgi:hypothetical protein
MYSLIVDPIHNSMLVVDTHYSKMCSMHQCINTHHFYVSLRQLNLYNLALSYMMIIFFIPFAYSHVSEEIKSIFITGFIQAH